MFKVINKIHKKTHLNRLKLFFDIIYCGFKYGAGYYDYQEFAFYLLSKEERMTYLTRAKNNLIIQRYNNKNQFYLFDNKEKFNQLFKKYLKRDYIVLKDNNFKDFKKFVTKHHNILVKPIDGEGGKGIMKIEVTKDANLEALFSTLLKSNQNLVEEYIKQNSKISELYPDSVNTLRLFTFFDGKASHVINAVFKLGNGGVTDNFSSGSMYTFVDNKGKVIVPAIDQNDNVYVTHPITNKQIVGFEVPFYKDACMMVKEAAKEVKDVKYVGWDVAITNKGPLIIEGNSFPGVFQVKPNLKKGMGLIPIYQKYMKIK